MKVIAAWLILMGINLSGCATSATTPADEPSEPVSTYDMELWYKMPPVERVSHRETLIPILKMDGTYYTVCRGLEIPLKETTEGLQWALTPSSMSETTIGFRGPSLPCPIRIVDRMRASQDDFYLPDEMPPIPMMRVDRPSGLLDATARRPGTLNDFLGFYQPVWFPWVRWEIRKDGEQYWEVEQNLDPPEPSGRWTTRGKPHELTPLSERLGLTGFPGAPHRLTYNEALKRFELVKVDSGIRMPLAKVAPSPATDAPLPPLPIGIPAWH
jgi:hypothetical protein